MFEKGLTKLGLPAKLLISCFLCVIGIGYLFSVYTVYIVHRDADARPGLSMDDIVLTYCGDREHTVLETVSLGSMSTYYASDDDKSDVINWIRDGADRETYESIVTPIMKRSCIMCHSKDGPESNSPLTTYEEVKEYVQISTGISPNRLGGLSHTHLISHGMMFFFLSLIFLATSVKDRYKIIIVLTAYFSVVADVFSWWLAKTAVGFAYVSVISGTIMGITFLFFFFVPLWEMWIKKK
jgi:hypothetical protein